MSADNGIYIGKFPVQNGSVEYRVIHAQAIENVYDDDFPTEVTDANRVLYFSDAKVFADVKDAQNLAYKMAQDCLILEYGISTIDFDRPLLDITENEANKILDNYWHTQKLKKTITTDAEWHVKDMEDFLSFREALFDAIDLANEQGEGGKTGDGRLSIIYPDWYSERYDDEKLIVIELYCYILGPCSHYRWKGQSIGEASRKAMKDLQLWIEDLKK